MITIKQNNRQLPLLMLNNQSATSHRPPSSSSMTIFNVILALFFHHLSEFGIDGVGTVVEVGRLVTGQRVQREGADQRGLHNDDDEISFSFETIQNGQLKKKSDRNRICSVSVKLEQDRARLGLSKTRSPSQPPARTLAEPTPCFVAKTLPQPDPTLPSPTHTPAKFAPKEICCTGSPVLISAHNLIIVLLYTFHFFKLSVE